MLSRDFQKLIETDTVAAARALLGMQLILNGQELGRIVETEAYLGSQDSACHSARGRRSPKNESMYLPAGHWYVYQIYGHHMLNLVTKAENVAEEYGISREEQDALALESQKRAVAAIESGRFKEEIVPVVIPQRKGDPIVFDTDEYPRKDASLESLSKLRPVFKKDGSVTAGNASGINDGAAAVLVMSAEKAEELGLPVIARIRSYASAGLDPKIMGCGPIYATRKALEKGNLTVDDLDLIESNEAFAAQACAVGKTLGFNTDIVNVNGGAIALGHPIGASGCRILVTLVHEMMKRDAKTGLATLCIGGGMGTALIVER